MARATTAAVTAYLGDVGSTDLTQFISDASTFVDSRLAGKGLGEAVLTAIETLVACHFASHALPRLLEQRTGEQQERFEGRVDKPGASMTDLSSTRFGRDAMAFDATRTLSGRRSSMKVFSTVSSKTVW